MKDKGASSWKKKAKCRNIKGRQKLDLWDISQKGEMQSLKKLRIVPWEKACDRTSRGKKKNLHQTPFRAATKRTSTIECHASDTSSIKVQGRAKETHHVGNEGKTELGTDQTRLAY